MTKLYMITPKGARQVSWLRVTQRINTSFLEDDVLRYLKKRKTPATVAEINKGAQAGFSLGYTYSTLGTLLRKRFITRRV